MNIKKVLDQSITRALQLAGASDSSAVIKQSQKAEFGQYQANGVMGAAKKLKMNPRELAAQVIEALDLPIAEKVEIAGPGFINIHLDAQAVAAALSKLHTDSMLGIEAPPRQSYVIDYSAPNLAKEMHIGHLRSTTMGDAAARILDFLGHDVTRANHVGDWGAQFGSLLAYMDQLEQSGEILSTELKDLEVFYKKASALFKSDEEFAIRARAYVVRLQSGDDRCLELWQQFISESINHCQGVYDKLNITLTRQDIKAESSYNDDLAVVVSELKDKGLLEISDGAKCVFLEEFKGKDDKPLPAIVQKSDGGYPYLASDIAALRYRSQTLNADNALYFIDARQRLHMRQLFAVSKAAGYLTQSKVFKHLPFGVILKDDGTPFKTRDGADVKLIDVIDEAIERAFRLVTSKNPDLDETIRRNISEVVGVGAIKYAELSKNRTTDYIFDWDTMLSFEGNTAPYLQYAYTRIRSIFRRAEIDSTSLDSKIVLQHPVEFALAVKLLQFPEAIDSVTDDFQANVLCNYLFEVSGQFMSFYEACPILNQDDEIKNSRLMIADITSKILKQGLELLGIQTVEKM
jgi:arginyl-tRNA synthetase|tara:strand:+ start:4966 stop:6690 length:1725 start_codon:yes stop_codon:yes gene_type:complete